MKAADFLFKETWISKSRIFIAGAMRLGLTALVSIPSIESCLKRTRAGDDEPLRFPCLDARGLKITSSQPVNVEDHFMEAGIGVIWPFLITARN
jgi:hypothetical protein